MLGVRNSGYSRPFYGRKQGVNDQILQLKQLSELHGNEIPLPITLIDWSLREK